MVISCKGCNASHVNSGALYIYEATSADSKKWSESAVLTSTNDLTQLGGGVNVVGSIDTGIPAATDFNGDGVKFDRNKLIASASASTGLKVGVVFSKEHDKWTQLQTLTMGSTVNTDFVFSMDIYDETIVLGSYLRPHRDITGTITTMGTVGIFYPSTDKFNLRPPGKPQPVQWSLQQLLVAPIGSTTTPQFGYKVAIDQNRLAVTTRETNLLLYIYERQHAGGQWSLQQSITSASEIDDLDIYGSTIMYDDNSGNAAIIDETANWDCLIVSVEDHFNDGWDTAKLTVDVPGGDKDFFASRCDTPNPFQFRYCPADKADKGLYKFSIPDGAKAKFHWELIWRVYEEATGDWYTGNWDTKMDFDWNAEKTQFTRRKIEKELPNNITCKVCKSRPTEKPSARLRQLKDSTVAPTISPAPTILTSVQIHPWQELRLISAAGADWFDSQHKGTSYYISTKDGHRLLSTGTSCPWERTLAYKTCWEDYPDGEYILRVGGALDRTTTHTFHFCHSANDISKETQIIFRIQNGECYIVSNVKSLGFCANSVGVTQVSSLDLSLHGASGSFGASERQALADALTSILPHVAAQDVHVVSAVSDGAGTTVSLTFSVSGHRSGINFADAEQLDAYEANVLSKLQSATAMGDLRVALSSVRSGLSGVTSVEFHGFALTGSAEEALSSESSPDMVTDMADGEYLTASSSEKESDSTDFAMRVVSIAGYAVGLMAVAVVGFFVFASKPVTQELPTSAVELVDESMTMPDVQQQSKKASKQLSLSDLQELVAQQDSALKSMMDSQPAI